MVRRDEPNNKKDPYLLCECADFKGQILVATRRPPLTHYIHACDSDKEAAHLFGVEAQNSLNHRERQHHPKTARRIQSN